MNEPSFPRVQRAYDAVARFGLNFFILFVLVNLAAALVAPHLEKTAPQRPPANVPLVATRPYAAVVPKDDPNGRPVLTKRRNWESLQWVDLKALAGEPSDETDTLLDEFGTFDHQGYQYEPYVGFAPYPCNGRTLNVDAPEAEFPRRRTLPAVDKAVTSVYVFGGSTSFGIYVSDKDTWPSSLQALLPGARVTNFGRPYYYSTQEVALFLRLLKTGHRPDVVVFMDGLNDCFMPFWEVRPDAPMFTSRMVEWIHMAQFGKDWLSQYRWIPLVRLAYVLHQRLWPVAVASGEKAPTTDEFADRIVDSYRENVQQVEALCQAYHVRPIFCWQPCPFYHYDMGLQRRTFLIPPPMYEVFNKVYERVSKAVPRAHFMGDVLQGYDNKVPAFVDNFHYSPAFGRYLAGEVSRLLREP